MLPLISVIVPIFNTEPFLDKCINSIRNQTYQNLEIILVNDGSTDFSGDKCEAYAKLDSRIRVIHKVNGGQSSARNVGLDCCRGQYVGFVDSDDWIAPTMYEQLYKLCYKDNIVSSIGIEVVDQDDIIVNKISFKEQVCEKEFLLDSILCHKDGGSVCSRLFPTAIISDNRFDESKLNEDVLFLISLLEKIDKVSYSSNIGYYYFQRTGSTSRSFGKSIHDMIGNAEMIKNYVYESFPEMSKQAERFELMQNMSFLFSCPFFYDTKNDFLYSKVIHFVRKNFIKGLINPFLTKKDKIKLLGLIISPKMMVFLLDFKSFLLMKLKKH